MNKMIEVTLKTPSGNEVTRRAHGPKSRPSLKIAKFIIENLPKEWEYISHRVVKEWQQ